MTQTKEAGPPYYEPFKTEAEVDEFLEQNLTEILVDMDAMEVTMTQTKEAGLADERSLMQIAEQAVALLAQASQCEFGWQKRAKTWLPRGTERLAALKSTPSPATGQPQSRADTGHCWACQGPVNYALARRIRLAKPDKIYPDGPGAAVCSRPQCQAYADTCDTNNGRPTTSLPPALRQPQAQDGWREKIIDAARQLADAEQTYRRLHGRRGDADIETGRAWDLMRRAGDRVRDALLPSPPGSQPSPAQADEIGWLIELRGHCSWWSLDQDDEPGWTKDSLKALRFARREDAEAYIADAGWTDAFASEHMWSSPKSLLGDRP